MIFIYTISSKTNSFKNGSNATARAAISQHVFVNFASAIYNTDSFFRGKQIRYLSHDLCVIVADDLAAAASNWPPRRERERARVEVEFEVGRCRREKLDLCIYRATFHTSTVVSMREGVYMVQRELEDESQQRDGETGEREITCDRKIEFT